MVPVILIDGNNLGHVLGYIDRQSGHYDSAGLLACLDRISHYLVSLGQEVEMFLFLDDPDAAERLGGWHVQVVPVPSGDADTAIRAFAQSRANQPLTLISADRILCDDAAAWGAVCLSPQAFISRYLVPAQDAGFCGDDGEMESKLQLTYVEASQVAPNPQKVQEDASRRDLGQADRKLYQATLKQAHATLLGVPLPPSEIFMLDLSRWTDLAELALYLAEHHLCPQHLELTAPMEMIAAIREHCSQQPRYFTSGRVINRVFRVFLCRSERSLSLDDLARLTDTRRRKIRAAINKQGDQLGIVAKD
jgi:hypothetical protein